MSQWKEVRNTMIRLGGIATLGLLYREVDTSRWGTKTPFATIRRIVQTYPEVFYRVRPGLWALTSYQENFVAQVPSVEDGPKEQAEKDHSYYEGLILQLGNWKGYQTFVTAQDKNKPFLSKTLKDYALLAEMPAFASERIVDRIKHVDAVWLNKRAMPKHVFEVEATTGIISALEKFHELVDIRVDCYVVADERRRKEYETIVSRPLHADIARYTKFLSYKRLEDEHSMTAKKRDLEEESGIVLE